jgi:hypothetical protein
MVEIGNKVTMKKWFIFNSKGLKNLDFQVSFSIKAIGSNLPVGSF